MGLKRLRSSDSLCSEWDDTVTRDGYEVIPSTSELISLHSVLDLVRARVTDFEKLPLAYYGIVDRRKMEASVAIGVLWSLPQVADVSLAQQVMHAEQVLKALAPEFCVLDYKFGVTSRIEDRWEYYDPDVFTSMVVVGCSLDCHAIAAAETELIRKHSARPYCRNKLGGIGQGTTYGQPPFHLYLVYG